MHRDRDQCAPEPSNDREHACATDEDPGEVGARHGQDVAEEVAHQIEPLSRKLGGRNKSPRQRRVREDAEQAVCRQYLLAAEHNQHGADRQRHDDDAERQIDPQRDAECDAEQTCMRDGRAEVRHAPPDDEAAERRRNDTECHACDQCADEKRLKHWMYRPSTLKPPK